MLGGGGSAKMESLRHYGGFFFAALLFVRLIAASGLQVTLKWIVCESIVIFMMMMCWLARAWEDFRTRLLKRKRGFEVELGLEARAVFWSLDGVGRSMELSIAE
jgi:hypothetical protein